ncbi:PDR/VanB family oxidoreductase [Rhodoblastus acidophilus]|uniref:PDR/VanB family oxidoreductase n=1 Tax=Candidatus Rhodoblastus alkanivorans TaxID=2954117 RepID=A0ABS9Z804_9HYPH|nr:PDR/VanB family oxidoreductase [Candidatus Rhodoblastus alkanivorans]MCI4677903.1 PDR/VanB family oxidoreductase [Candidatus Rhodoblastus alkanivorans]MCI4683799.1 PDR/VanB family oxidoreductase [Candidatus Rhodoblastus alkanivorans]MDI4641117.1 PDR/VanB family oxidoreductase [Rhodoblastus acidophilus]
MSHSGLAVADGWLQAIVARKTTEAEDIVRLSLRPEGGVALPPFEAGAHIEIALPNGLIRPYSLCNAAHEAGRYEIAVLLEREGRGGSLAAHGLVEGQALPVRPPRNFFPLAPDGYSLLIAGGIGITPLLAMAETLADAGRGVELHACARSERRAAFRARLAAAPFAASVRWHFDDGAPDQKFDIGAVLAGAPEDARLYVCGPQGFMDHVLGAARARGWPEDRLHYEYFAAAPSPAEGDRPFRIVLARSGRTIDVPAGVTAAQAMAEAGVEPPLSCEQGVCGTCLLPVIEGQPDHRDHFQNPAERAANTHFAACCSRAVTPRLVLDF